MERRSLSETALRPFDRGARRGFVEVAADDSGESVGLVLEARERRG